LFLPAKSRAALNDLGHFIDAKHARLKQGYMIETEQFREAQYLKFRDLCGSKPVYEQLVACFIKKINA
jgi:hypothetical protein